MPHARVLTTLAAVAALLALAAPQALAASPSGVEISQLRLRTAASPFDEYVELRNTAASTVTLAGWKLDDCFTSGGTRRVGTEITFAAGTSIPAGRTLVLGKDRNDYTGEADLTYPFQVAEDGGFIVRDAAGAVQDKAGAPGTQCAEGAGLTAPVSGSDFTFRRTQDTDDNAADFAGPAGSADGTPCGDTCLPPLTPTPIDAIQGAGSTSPRQGQRVEVTGVVVGVDNQEGVSNFVDVDPSQAGIYVEAPAAAWDADPATSEGIFVGGLPKADRDAAHVGETVTVTGTVREIFNLTSIDASGRRASFGAPAAELPAAQVIDTARARAQRELSTGSRDYYETLEGMRVTLPSGTADSGGTSKFGELFLRPEAPLQRVFRADFKALAHGPADLIGTAQDAGSAGVDPGFPSENPASTTRVEADLFDTVTGLTGPLGFSFSQYKVVPQPGAAPVVVNGPTTYPAQGPGPVDGTIRVAAFNVENFFGVGMTDDGHAFTAQDVDTKATRIADAVGRILQRPDVVSVEEVAAGDALEAVAAKLGDYSAYWRPSNDARHIAVGFLVKDGVKVEGLRQLGQDATTTAPSCNDAGSSADQLFNRPPLAIELRKGALRFTAIGNHWASQSHPEACREQQAAFVRGEVAAIERAGGSAIVLGDLNDFEDSTALTQFLIGGGTTLANLWSQAPPENRYSYLFDGQLQTLDHVLVTDGVHTRVRDFRYVHLDNDYFERDPLTDGHKLSDHDVPVATIQFSNGRLGG